MQHVTKPRRKFISGAAAAGAAALGFPAVTRAQNAPISFRFQSTWPATDIFHEFARDYAAKVNEMAGGQLKIEVLPAGAVVKAFDLLDAVSAGTLDGGHGVVAYWYGKNTAVALWGSGPSFGMDANMLLAWHQYGGGKELLVEIQKAMGVNVVSLMYGPMPTQPFGWFKRPITKVEEVKGVKFRTVGLAIDMYTAMGAAVNALPGGEIVPALDRGLLDGAEFNNASSDLALGFQDVSKICMLQSFHQSAEQFEVLFNKAKYDALPEHLKHILSYAAQAASADMSWKAANRYSQDYIKLQQEHKVKFYKTPDAILQQQLKIWDEMIAKRSAENPLFKKVLDSQRAFAERVGRWHGDTSVNFRMAYNHYFSRGTKSA
ncbi:TRAP transporter substrate-binding protein [Achromobacter deleyi]|uniref:TRAP transporter substrate-binding protein n=1 Tax=Achromobacter deleyi TaxID=1353891 RepID=UPI0014915263|nr:TRAP transporter substrate-binding protein [Achromobacter deleyi]QVQ27810.1 TRAP transporter substrate-binding protein [Achromobacter deleyi]UIP23414.1 TRAP transporter substrate-binding protein [Achromobacter deleyi]